MKQRIFSHFQDYLIQCISHQYQELLYCNSSQYILSAYNSQHNNNNNFVLAMTMPYSGQGWRHSALPFGRVVHYVFNPDHYIGIVIANTTLLYKYNMSFVWLTANMAIYRAALRAARPNAVPCKTCSVLLDVDAHPRVDN
jgi:hypothetical protein